MGEAYGTLRSQGGRGMVSDICRQPLEGNITRLLWIFYHSAVWFDRCIDTGYYRLTTGYQGFIQWSGCINTVDPYNINNMNVYFLIAVPDYKQEQYHEGKCCCALTIRILSTWHHTIDKYALHKMLFPASSLHVCFPVFSRLLCSLLRVTLRSTPAPSACCRTSTFQST